MMPVPTRAPIWRLSELLVDIAQIKHTNDTQITGLALDSRLVRPGDLFLAVPGGSAHGIRYLGQAIERGAAAVVWEPTEGQESSRTAVSIPVVKLPNLRHMLGTIADRFFCHPSREMTVIGVTGTDGKTSVSQFLAQALHQPGQLCGIIGTLGYGLYGQLLDGPHTTPDAIRLQAELSTLREFGARHVVMEVSSHALEQRRVDGTALDMAVLTNVSRDHFDYHGSLKSYAGAKRRLFDVPTLRHAVLNLDDAFGKAWRRELDGQIKVLGYRLSPGAAPEDNALVVTRIDEGSHGLCLELHTPWGEGALECALLGRFNASNLLATLGVLLLLGVPLADALHRLSRLRTVTGRMESFGGGEQPLVVVDYAHTPAALENVLSALRAHCRGRLWCVFGCGGDRDPGKRSLMGSAAQRLADEIIITDDNPRHESPAGIVKDILAGVSNPDFNRVVHDRTRAIAMAVNSALRDDVVLIAGKGHERAQIVGDQRRPFSDQDEVLVQLKRLTWS